MPPVNENVARAKALLSKVPLIGILPLPFFSEPLGSNIATDKSDGHNDLPFMIRGWYQGRAADEEVDAADMPVAHTDLTRLRKGCVGGVFWSAYSGKQRERRLFDREPLRVSTGHPTADRYASLTQHPRNSPDEVLDMLKANGGVFMISFLCKLTDSSSPTLKRVADHIQHAGERIGYDHVGIGSDFDGMMDSPSGLEDVSKMPFLVAELLKRGIPEDSVQNIVGLNVLRVLDAVQEVSARMKNGNQDMLQDVIDEIWDEHVRLQVKQVRGLLSPDDDSFISTQKGSVDAIRKSD
ncbi:hypothetical protein ED733_002334 [Metarhizium rileyi]|uniref:Dipeptidase n=1 Tax=Metarhizium rileyi (strain RCEF 4871) TaxID=1649241 RepID=A0A5C6GAB1_METRR|nr:hypothetical protein ED733_002334 [Metarhizium rileyi]